MGRVLLAATDFTPDDPELADKLQRVRRDGSALVDQELEEGLRSIAVPIRDGGGSVVAAMNLSTHAARRTVAAMRAELLPALRETAARVEADHAAGPVIHRRAT
jgi:IclR family pca regulon transcriptional regulator